jgi:deaminated glutathione amidase
MKIAALQTVSTPDVDRNLATATRLIAEAAEAGAELVALPEYFCLMGRRDDDKLRVAETAGHGPIQQALSEAARRHRVWVVGGTLPLRPDNGADNGADSAADSGMPPPHALNSCLVFAPSGEQAARYDKIHLFAFDNGRESYDEGRTLRPGAAPVAFQAGPMHDGQSLRVGLSICYDLRFPELYRSLMQPPCDLLCVPAAFTYTTGRAHWELLLRARAVENQCFVLAAAQGGTHENGRSTWGHSLICDPWGEVLALREEGEGVVIAELDLARMAEVRTQLPALAHRRL